MKFSPSPIQWLGKVFKYFTIAIAMLLAYLGYLVGIIGLVSAQFLPAAIAFGVGISLDYFARSLYNSIVEEEKKNKIKVDDNDDNWNGPLSYT